MKSSFLRLLTSAAVALALTSVVSFAEEPAKTDAPAPAAEPAKTEPAKQEAAPEKKKEDEKSPCCPNEAPKSEISGHCGKCDKKDEPSTAPATEPAKTDAPKSEISSHCGKCDKKDEPTTAPATEPVKQEQCPEKKEGEQCPPAPAEAPKA